MRERKNMDLGWKFFRGDLAPHANTDGWGGGKGKSFYFGATAMNLDDSGWKDADLPHDFVLEGDYTRKTEVFVGSDRVPDMETIDSRHFAGGSLEGGIGWYRKKFFIPEEYDGKRIFLTFDGIFRNSSIYVNEHFAVSHESGYTGFTCDITEMALFGEENLVAVRVDATGREGWWYEGGGIYRHVWMTVTEPVYVPKNGVFVNALPEGESAVIAVETEVESRRDEDEEVCVCSRVLDAMGREVCRASRQLKVSGWDKTAFRQEISMEKACFWSPETPYLYTMRTQVWSEGRLLDEKDVRFGVRSIEIDTQKGLMINGKAVRVKGFCQHMDHAGVGIALPDKLMKFRLEKVKELGANACRCSHNPPAPEFLDLCDEMGILVMDETRKTSVSEESLAQLRQMVKRDRNHPCIYCWCIGNEEVNLQFEPEAGRIVHAMRMEIRKLDKSRPVTMALVYWNPNAGRTAADLAAEELLPAAQNLDVAGFNYNADKWDAYRALGRQPMMNTEASSGGWTRSCYETDADRGHFYALDPKNGDKNIRKWNPDSLCNAKRMLQMYMERPWLAGYFVWTAFDYRGEPTPMPYPAISTQFGVMDYCGFRKDIAWFYQSWWSDEPALHLFPHWNLTGQEGKPVDVYCYTNLEETELFVNGKGYGRKRVEKGWFLRWEGVVYEPGTLCAVGYRDGREVLREEVHTAKAAARLELVPYEKVIRADGSDLAIVNVRVLDQDGILAVTADPQITFRIEGAGMLAGVGNGDPGSHESDKRPVRRAFHGLCQLLVRASQQEGEIRITASAEGMEDAACSIRCEKEVFS